MAQFVYKDVEKRVICKGVTHIVTEKEMICSHCGTAKYEGLDADLWSDWDIAFCPHCGEKIEK